MIGVGASAVRWSSGDKRSGERRKEKTETEQEGRRKEGSKEDSGRRQEREGGSESGADVKRGECSRGDGVAGDGDEAVTAVRMTRVGAAVGGASRVQAAEAKRGKIESVFAGSIGKVPVAVVRMMSIDGFE